MRYQHLKIYRTIRKILIPLTPLVIAIALLSLGVRMPEFFRTAGITIMSPFWHARSTLNTSFSADVGSQEILTLQRETLLIRALERDNARLKELLGRTSDADSLFIAGVVLHGAQYSPYDTLIVDRGLDDGIREGMLVVTGEGLAVGFVKTAHTKTSTVTLFSGPSSVFSGILQGQKDLHAQIYGQGSGSMIMTTPRGIEIAEGDTIVLPSFDTYLVGTVALIEVSPEDAYKTVYIRSSVNTRELRHILIDTGSIWRPHEQDATQVNTE